MTIGWEHSGVRALSEAPVLTALVVLIAVGGASILLTQASFQAGGLGASFPANLVADPILAIVLGAVLLHEKLPLSALRIGAYAVCVGAIGFATAQLAAGSTECAGGMPLMAVSAEDRHKIVRKRAVR